ncbi:MAG: hypothetical protein IKJ34_06080 [Mailhella sp.]|nr:hypothetical protein [Mailhella sp.]
MRKMSCLILLFISLLLVGCGKSYTVAVDAMRDDSIASGINYYIEPGREDIAESDLFFRELKTLVTPVFNARGWNVVLDKSIAHNVTRMSFWNEEPRVETYTTMTTQSYPVVVGHGRHRHVEYVYHDVPVVESRTIYTVHLQFESYALEGAQKKERQIWRTALRCSSLSPNQRDLIYTMAQVLPSVLATSSGGLQYYEVMYEQDGRITVTPLPSSNLW